ncbi:MAG TPA: M28 family peptidase [Terriglobia bacterium]
MKNDMRSSALTAVAVGVLLLIAPFLLQSRQRSQAAVDDPVKTLAGRLDLERYKATLRGLAQFGDRRQGTERNRKAVDWIDAQLKSYGCTNTERVKYMYPENPVPQAAGARGGRGAAGAAGAQAAAPRGQVARGVGGVGRQAKVVESGEIVNGPGGSRVYGVSAAVGVNNDPNRQPDARLRELNVEPSKNGPREEVYCTKVGATHPEEMYIVAGHMDGIGWGEAVNDDGSGTALVMELARIFNMPDVQTDRSIRFALWNNEESGLNGARAYVAQRAALQGKEDPPGSKKYPEPRWLGMIQHDMMMWDHGMPRPDGTWNPEQRPEADVNIEFQSTSKFADDAMKLAFFFRAANEKYATDYPAAVGPHMTNTDSDPFMNLIPAISFRENERGMQTGGGWNPTWHQPIDVYSTFSDKDFRLGLNAAQTTLGAVGQLAGAKLKK